jgi:hypothetical protein
MSIKSNTGLATLAIVIAVAAMATAGQYEENFTTRQFRDKLNTTAWWDSVVGEIKLRPFYPTLAGGYDTPGSGGRVAIAGDYAFVADSSSGLAVIDISDPTNPWLATNSPGSPRDIAISGDYAYLVNRGTSLKVIDIKNPIFPFIAGTYTMTSPRGVAISGDHAYVADGDSGLAVIDISDPTTPSFAGRYDTPGLARGVAVSGDHAYVADGDSGLAVIDISDPTTPSFAGSYDTPGGARRVAVTGDYAYVADDASLQVIDISDPTRPSYAGGYDTPGGARDVTISGDRAYVASRHSGLQVFDISDPTNPLYAGGYDTPGYATGVAVSGDHAFVGDGASGLQVIRISYPVPPFHAGSYDTAGDATGVAISGDHAFVGNGASGLGVIDISDPTTPSFAGSYDTPGSARGVAVAGDHVYVADGDSGFLAIDISDPAKPQFAGSFDTAGSALGVATAGDYAYVAEALWGLQVIDISDPTSPSLAADFNTATTAAAVATAGDYAYVADKSEGLVVLDISDPTLPTWTGASLPADAWDVAISGNYAYVADELVGLLVFSISDPAVPFLWSSYPIPGDAHGVALSGNYAYVANSSSGLHVIDISEPFVPSYAGSYDTPGLAEGVAIAGNYAFVADDASGLQVIEVFQHSHDLANNIGQSTTIANTAFDIAGVKIESTQNDSIMWELSPDGGGFWQEIPTGGPWTELTSSGSDLLWRSTHVYPGKRVNPTCSYLKIEWLYDAAVIDSVADVPNDQGGQVRVHFTRSGYDISGALLHPISTYNIWRRIDDLAALGNLGSDKDVDYRRSHLSGGDSEGDLNSTDEKFGNLPVFKVGGKYYIESDEALLQAGFPSGTWEVIASFAATQMDQYIYTAATAADSSGTIPYFAFCVTAHTTTPSIWYASAPDSGYSVDNIPPGIPLGFSVAYNTGSGNQLSWDPAPEPDFRFFKIYRDTDPGFIPGPPTLRHFTTSTSWTDPDFDGWNVYYKITAEDTTGNASAPASPGTATAMEEPPTPERFALYQNAPNPFNPVTTIRFDIPARTSVRLSVYNIKGQLVRDLLNGLLEPGRKQVHWDGKDNAGHGVASGMYFYRLVTPEFTESRKMILLR